MFNRDLRSVGACIAISAFAAGVSRGGPPERGEPDAMLRIGVSDARGEACIDLLLPEFYRNSSEHTYRWTLEAPVEFYNDADGGLIATIRSIDFIVRRWSQFELTLDADAGEFETVFTITSTSLSFPTLAPNVARGRARARFYVTDRNSNGASLVGLGPPGTGAFIGRYHDAYGVGRLFSQLVGSVVCGPGGSGYGEQRDPFSGYRTIKDGASAIEMACGFTLSAGDGVVVTTSFDVNPDPPNCAADLDGNGIVSVDDLMTLLQNFGRVGALFDEGDTDGDGDVDVDDLLRLMNEFGGRCP